ETVGFVKSQRQTATVAALPRSDRGTNVFLPVGQVAFFNLTSRALGNGGFCQKSKAEFNSR
ncbi:MAG: hypothetical protein PHW11_09070, partial [Anaerolineaceae bacterium]|nr:hypothetical protein [Anaerolineaceae bacterium]